MIFQASCQGGETEDDRKGKGKLLFWLPVCQCPPSLFFQIVQNHVLTWRQQGCFAATVIYFSALTTLPFLCVITCSSLGSNKYPNFLQTRRQSCHSRCLSDKPSCIRQGPTSCPSPWQPGQKDIVTTAVYIAPADDEQGCSCTRVECNLSEHKCRLEEEKSKLADWRIPPWWYDLPNALLSVVNGRCSFGTRRRNELLKLTKCCIDLTGLQR